MQGTGGGGTVVDSGMGNPAYAVQPIKLPITITQAGLRALIDARAGTTNSVKVASIGLSSTPFVMAPTLDAVPGEIKRLETVSGMAVNETVVHFTATDSSSDGYTATGFGLYLTTGELFGVFSLGATDGPLFQKSSLTSFLFAADIAFQAGDPSLITFPPADMLYPPASEIVKGVAYIADQATAAAGVDDSTIMSPLRVAESYIPKAQRGQANGVATLDGSGRVPSAQLPPVSSIDTFTVASQAEMLALSQATPGDFARRTDLSKTYVLTANPASTLGNWVEFLSPGAPVRTVNSQIGDVVLGATDVGAAPTGRKVNSSGLITGGGDLSADRTLNVDIATAAEALAGQINNKAVTPASLASILQSLAAAVTTARHVDTAGLATGGGDLTQNRTITVPKAAAADVEGMVDDTKAITAKALAGTLRQMGPVGFLRIPGTPLILMWGYGTYIFQRGGTGRQYCAFPTSFPSACWHVYMQTTSNTDDGDEADEPVYVGQKLNGGFYVNLDAADCPTFSYDFLAIGM